MGGDLFRIPGVFGMRFVKGKILFGADAVLLRFVLFGVAEVSTDEPVLLCKHDLAASYGPSCP